jgi:4-amino-4-deoxychorismate lyase
MNSILFRGNQRIDALSPQDRGLAYGDGLFETLLAVDGQLPWWPAHWLRLAQGAQRLAIALPDENTIRAAAVSLAANRRGVIKIILTRGESGRGYLPGDGPATCIVSAHPATPALPKPLTLHWCDTPLSEQPALAGIKHLNRLENVLARRECDLAGHPEGLMCDREGRVICATSANVFVHADGIWQTPEVRSCGIAGIARGWIIGQVSGIREATVTRRTLESADAVFLCNAVRGIMPVAGIGERRFDQSTALDGMQAYFLAANPFFGNT